MKVEASPMGLGRIKASPESSLALEFPLDCYGQCWPVVSPIRLASCVCAVCQT